MEIIKIRHPYQKNQIPAEEVVLVLGFFDGVHLGHQKVIETGKKIADQEGLKLALMTFNQHPSIVFKKIDPASVKYLTTLEQKEEKMAALGVDFLYEIDFTSAFAHLAPQDFVDQYIVGLHAKYAVSGFDYTYGPKDVADVEHLPEYANNRFEVVTVQKEVEDGEKISSTRIRQLLDAGNVTEVTKLLGSVYEIEGVVVHGDARGRLLGFPTANVKVKGTVHLPREGVYVSEIKVGDNWYPAMGSIGHNDTFGEGRELTVELFILDFNQDIYGEHVVVRWNEFLRDQVKFTDVDGLIAQLKKDEADTAAYFKK
ncbi:riboflavin biosynthesis protein [Enterococcus thailandicus]|uniref:Riboflavin biosynthesis protein n=1 Tax=Enterococcus thailandicus TaxID=417368 RepID=A0A1L8XR83_ENTTH|nr:MULTISPECIES: riboflavin biosynthesis protein RibF [Enterococcus]ASZ07287.1 riboflavin biosynthesis protein RibF [Enterococcus thailandicus]MDK4351342.1 riboflavin biosynthesis protein RibF [Enterococcus thailandicus]MDT2732925.1 riboflavin biosynthesis protein RibF [Enterococcus thailandicus]MDT2752004.1 riboflavin biosynthesis protein RibF [Enterococcus thailandicus]MDT2777118.1 riboflavin biosynthesis protein RibF [Enterococcus thailandicus]